MNKFKVYLISIIVFLVLLFVVFKFILPKDIKKSKDVKATSFGNLVSQLEGQIVRTSELAQNIEVSGSILPFDETNLMSEVSGRVVVLNLPEGRSVNKGTLLVKLFDGDLQAQLKMLEVQLHIAQNNEQRMKTLYNIKGTSQQEYDASLLQVNNLEAQIEILKVNIGRTEIRAPYDGVLGLKKISIGQYITPAIQIITIRDIKNLKLDFSIAEKYGSSMVQGSNVEFTISGSDKIYKAKVIANEESIETDSRNLNVRAVINGSTPELIPGAFAKVKANLGTKNNAILIPTSSIVPQANLKKVFVAKNGIAKSVTIKTGIREADAIEVLSGIQAGDTLVVSGIMFVKPNSPIKFSKIK